MFSIFVLINLRRYAESGKCRLGQQCCDAHGEEELYEWKERFDYRQTKLQRAKECSLQGRNYTEELLEKWLTSTNPNLIMTESLDTVDITVEPVLNLMVSERNTDREWTFHISAKVFNLMNFMDKFQNISNLIS